MTNHCEVGDPQDKTAAGTGTTEVADTETTTKVE